MVIGSTQEKVSPDRAAVLPEREPGALAPLGDLLSGHWGTWLGAAGFVVLLAIGFAMVQPGRALVELVAGVGGPTWAVGRAVRARGVATHRQAIGFVVTLVYWTLATLLTLWVGLRLSEVLVAAIALVGIAVPAVLAALTSEPRHAMAVAVSGAAVTAGLPGAPDAADEPSEPADEPALDAFDRSEVAPSSVGQALPWVALQVVALVVGGALVALANMWADRGLQGHAPYVLFWFGMAAMLVPVAYCVIRGRSRWTGLVALGLLAYFPRFVRAPSVPFEHDEIGHWLQATNLFRTSRLFLHNPVVPQARNFPGLHVLTVALQELTGMTTWRTGTFLLAAFHLLTLLGLYRLGSLVAGRRSGGAAAAVIYAVTPEFNYFDSLYAYESFAVPLFVWTLAALASARHCQGRGRRAWIALGATTLATALVTHHVTSYELLICLAVLAIGFAVVRSAHDRHLAAVCAIMAAGGAVFAFSWQEVLHAGILHYLAVYPQSAITTGIDTLFGRHPGSHAGVLGGGAALGRRTLFAGNAVPGFEVALAFIEPIVFFLIAGGSWLASRRRVDPFWLLATVLSVAYFVTLPFALTVAGEAIPHRSSATTLVGVALLAGAGASRLAAVATRATRRWWARPVAEPQRSWTWSVVAFLLLCGSYGIGVNVESMFGGSFLPLSDSRSVSAENIGVAQWILHHDGPGQVVLADSRDEVVLEAWGRAEPGPSWLGWETIFPAVGPPASVARKDVEAHVRFIVVDDRLATQVPQQGYYFSSGYEPEVPQPLPVQSITKFSRADWLRLVHRTPHYAVYQVLSPPRR